MSRTNTDRRVTKLVESTKINPKNLISTLLGDVVAVNGGSIWLGSIVEVCNLFNIAEYLSRTTSFRLVKDEWCTSTRVGRNSYYSFSDSVVRNAKLFYPKIYEPPVRSWAGKWHMLLTFSSGMTKGEYRDMRRALTFSGVGQIAPHIFVSASDKVSEIRQLLSDLGIGHEVEILETRSANSVGEGLSKESVETAWNIEDLERDYNQFLDIYRPIYHALENDKERISSQTAFKLRLMVVMSYRRISLRDPQLPQPFLPNNWAGLSAYTLCQNIYKSIIPQSLDYIYQNIQTANGPITQTSRTFFDRFGGLPDPSADKEILETGPSSA